MIVLPWRRSPREPQSATADIVNIVVDRVAGTLAVAADGLATWEAPTMDLDAVDGPAARRDHGALTQLGETLTEALPAAAFRIVAPGDRLGHNSPNTST